MGSDPFLEMLSPSTGEKILDIGAGKGRIAFRVLQASKGAEVYAVEPNEKRVASIKRDFPAIKSSVGTAETLPYPDSFFEKAYTTMALHHFSDLDGALHEVARVLKPGGSFVILELEPDSGLGTLFRFFGRLMGERMVLMTREHLQARLESTGAFRVVRSAGDSRYLTHAART